MAKSKQSLNEVTLLSETNELLKKQLILQLAQLKVSNQEIRKIIGCDMNYITSFLKPLKDKF